MAPVLVEGKPQGDILVYPPTEPGGTLHVQGPAFLDLMKDWVSANRINELSSRVETGPDKTRVLSTDAIKAIGVAVAFDERALELRVTVPPDVRATNLIYLNGRGVPPPNGEALSPSPLSGYVTVNASDQVNFNHLDGNDGRQPITTALASALNYKSWVLEANGTDVTNTATPFTRGDVRLLKDWPEKMIRFQGGDLTYPVSTYQVYRPMAGFTAASNFSLQPYRVTVPVGSHEIFLLSPSKVVVYINGAQTQVLFLPAGRQDLRNLALGNGVNFIRLEITDSAGRVENIEFPWITEADLLVPGLHQFAYSVGAPSTYNGTVRVYNAGLMTTSIFHRYGVSDKLTVGANLQFDHTQQIGGLEILASTLLGTFDVEPTLTNQPGASNAGVTGGGRVRYIYTDYGGQSNTQRNFTLGLEYKGPHFAQLGDVTPYVLTALDVQASYSQLILNRIAARLSVTYDLNRPGGTAGSDNGNSESLSLVKSWTSGFQTTVTLTHSITQAGSISNDAFFLLSWVLPNSNHYFSASDDTLRQSSRVEWHYNTPQLANGFNAGASFERDPGTNEADANLQYIGNRGIIGATHDLTTTWGGTHSQTTTLSAAASLAFAGGRFALGRPITDSFAIIATADELSGQIIEANPNSGKYYETRTDILGPGVLPTISAYQYYNINLDPSHLDPGLELGRENYTFLPTYQSGVLIRAGTDSTILASGRIVDSKDQPLSLVSGEARPVGPIKGETPAKPVFVFTNRKGKFRLEGFRPGTYELELYETGGESGGGGAWAPITITIPDGIKGVYDVGVLKARQIK